MCVCACVCVHVCAFVLVRVRVCAHIQLSFVSYDSYPLGFTDTTLGPPRPPPTSLPTDPCAAAIFAPPAGRS
jgi:hypothetical protein